MTPMGIQPTNAAPWPTAAQFGQLKNGKAVHDWIYWDTGHLLRQLRVLSAVKAARHSRMGGGLRCLSTSDAGLR